MLFIPIKGTGTITVNKTQGLSIPCRYPKAIGREGRMDKAIAPVKCTVMCERFYQ